MVRARQKNYQKTTEILIYIFKITIKIFDFFFVAPRPKVKSKKKVVRTGKKKFSPNLKKKFPKDLKIFTKNMEFSLKYLRKLKFAETCIYLEKKSKIFR